MCEQVFLGQGLGTQSFYYLRTILRQELLFLFYKRGVRGLFTFFMGVSCLMFILRKEGGDIQFFNFEMVFLKDCFFWSYLSKGFSLQGFLNKEREVVSMFVRISFREGFVGLYTDGMQVSRIGFRRFSVRVMRERVVILF